MNFYEQKGIFIEMKENTYLKKLRIESGYTYQSMADKLEICKAHYWQIEHNNRRLSYDLSKKIARVFSLKPDDIFYNQEMEIVQTINEKEK